MKSYLTIFFYEIVMKKYILPFHNDIKVVPGFALSHHHSIVLQHQGLGCGSGSEIFSPGSGSEIFDLLDPDLGKKFQEPQP